jgi:hypothetical protein
MALVALFAIGPKYGGRQSRIELQYQARERSVVQLDAGDAMAGKDDEAARRRFATAEDTLIPLWPLALFLLALVIVAVIILARARLRRGALTHETPP